MDNFDMMKIVSNKKIGDNHQMSKFVSRKFLHFGENCGYNRDSLIQEVILMKFSKELEERIDKAIEEYETLEKEGKIEWYTHEEVMKSILGDEYRTKLHYSLYDKSKKKIANHS